MELFERSSEFPVTAGQLFQWHERPGAFDRLNPPWSPVTVVSQTGGIRNGARVVLKVPVGPLKIRWELEHRNYKAGESFSDVQVHGPFSSWEHTHKVESLSPESSRLTDSIHYKLPLGPIGHLLKGVLVERELDRLFKYRHAVLRNDLALTSRMTANRPLRIVISGASGLVGLSLSSFLTVAGHEVWKLVRRKAASTKQEIAWDPEAGTIESEKLEGVDAIIHLAGENISAKRWSPQFKAQILGSRINSTGVLVDAIKKLKSPPKTFLSASATGFYGNRSDELLTEETHKGEGFLAEVADRWELVARDLDSVGIRTAQLRLGIVLSPRGGALGKMLLPFLAGAGGIVGNGSQYMSWASLDDVVGAFYHCLVNNKVRGPVNVVAPRAATNLEFTRTLGAVLKRPTIIPAPSALLHAMFGEMADALLLASTRVVPRQLDVTGYQFLFPNLEAALRHQLGR